jgi:hypothetical protein
MRWPGVIAILLLGLFGGARAGVVINEVLYDPPGDDSGLERIELYNNGSAAVNLAGWELYPARTPYYRFGTFTLQPGTWVIIHLRESGTDTPTDLYEGTAPTQNMGNTTGSVALFDSSYHGASTLMDFMEYGAGGQTWESAAVQDSIWVAGDFVPDAPEGSSIGLFPNGADNNRSTDWREFRFPTLGKKNLFAPVLSNAKAEPDSLVANGGSAALLSVRAGDGGSGLGITEADLSPIGGSLHQRLYDDGTHGDLVAGDSVYSYSASAGGVGLGRKTVYLQATDSTSTAWSKDSVSVAVVGGAGSGLVINELMYSPIPGSPEWVEIYNRGQAEVDLAGWFIQKGDTAGRRMLSNRSVMLGPGGYVVLSSDSLNPKGNYPTLMPIGGMISLKNEGDAVTVTDSRGVVMDQVNYRPSWGGKTGISLERVSPEIPSQDSTNWGSCVDPAGSTPGIRNSLFVTPKAGGGKISASPNPFSPDGDGYDDRTVVTVEIPAKSALARIYIYDVMGRLVRRLLDQEQIGSTRSVVWDGKSDRGEVLEMGMYVLYLEAIDALNGMLARAKGTVVLAKRMR